MASATKMADESAPDGMHDEANGDEQEEVEIPCEEGTCRACQQKFGEQDKDGTITIKVYLNHIISSYHHITSHHIISYTLEKQSSHRLFCYGSQVSCCRN